MTVLIFKFIGDRTDVAYLQTKYNPLRGLYSLQIGNADKLQYQNSHFLNALFFHKIGHDLLFKVGLSL
jgi:catalase